MGDFSVSGDSYNACLINLEQVLKRCEKTNLVLNWEKFHFMVIEGIVLGHKISKPGLEVDQAKIDAIAKLPAPTNVKTLGNFLGHVGFYRCFIRGFTQIARPLSALLEANRAYEFDASCQQAFESLREALIIVPILVASYWLCPFEMMCDASSYVVGAVLRQRKDMIIHPIF